MYPGLKKVQNFFVECTMKGQELDVYKLRTLEALKVELYLTK